LSSISKLKNEGPRINVFNRQRKLNVDLSSLRDFLASVVNRLKLEKDFSVVLVSDRAMKKFNTQFAGKPCPTDVLSFAADSDEEPYLGDIIVSVESAERQRTAELVTELRILSLHGLLHLMGYDHETDDGEMNSFETALREEFGLE